MKEAYNSIYNSRQQGPNLDILAAVRAEKDPGKAKNIPPVTFVSRHFNLRIFVLFLRTAVLLAEAAARIWPGDPRPPAGPLRIALRPRPGASRPS